MPIRGHPGRRQGPFLFFLSELFDIEAAPKAEPSIDAQLATLREQLTRIDLEQLGEEEKERLLNTMSKLLKG